MFGGDSRAKLEEWRVFEPGGLGDHLTEEDATQAAGQPALVPTEIDHRLDENNRIRRKVAWRPELNRC